jgi:hypothetical protein
MVRKGRAAREWLGNDYIEIRFEDLVADPRSVLRTLSAFLEQQLDYDCVLKNAVGAVARPNTSFRGSGRGEFNPVARWKEQFTAEQLGRVEGLVGNTLKQLGYELASKRQAEFSAVGRAWNHLLYRQFFELKLQWKKNGLARALRPPLTSKEIDDVVLVDEASAARMRAAATKTGSADLTDERSKAERLAQHP